MKKKKINMKKYKDMHTEVTIAGDDGTEITVRTRIPYEDKIAMATELAEQTIMIHDDSALYISHEEKAIKILMALKYYTSVNTDGVTPGEAFDFVYNNEMEPQLYKVISHDYNAVIDIYHRLFGGVDESFKDDRSIQKAIRRSFGFLFNGEDVTESLAKAEAMKDVMYNAIGALREKEKEESERITDGKLNVGGNILNFARK